MSLERERRIIVVTYREIVRDPHTGKLVNGGRRWSATLMDRLARSGSTWKQLERIPQPQLTRARAIEAAQSLWGDVGLFDPRGVS